MKTAIILSAIASLVSAEQYFYAVAAYSGSPIHLRPIHANHEGLWIGKPTSRYCPDEVRKQGGCPNGTGTNYAGGDNTLALGAAVPGGQEVYINRSNGKVQYTAPHSADTGNGIIGGWSHVPNTGNGVGTLSWRRGLVACPTTEEDVYEVFANLKSIDFSPGCIGPFSAVTSNTKEPAAWEYL